MEWPVVLKVPALETTLYSGQIYIPVVGYTLSTIGIKWTKGRSLYNSLGFGSSIMCSLLSHFAPSKYIP